MLQISSKTMQKAREIQGALQIANKPLAPGPDDAFHWLGILRALLQSAIKLETSTIPPYFCAYFTLKPGTNQEVAEVIRSVVKEEMLHMSIAANILIAIRGAPVINHPSFIPTYPGT